MVVSTAVISGIKFIGGGWAGGGGVGRKPKAGNTIHNEIDSSIVFPVGHRNSHSQPGRPKRSLTHHVALLVPLSGSVDPLVDHHGFTGLAKDRL